MLKWASWIGFLFSTIAQATPHFPYATRTKDYSGWSPAIQSDTNTTGMAAATVALPSSISSAESNPAGFAMQTGSVSAQINRISITDKRIQPDGHPIDSNQAGLGVSPPPWGFSLSYYSPFTERDTYLSPNTGHALPTEVSLKEFRLTVARSFFESRLAIGVSGVLAIGIRELGSYSYNAYAPSFRVGALFRISNHVVYGASYAPALTIGPTSDGVDQNEMPGFNQSLLRPSQMEVGVGWVPNRFFKAGFSISRVGNTSNTALLADQTLITGPAATFTPRIGASYILVQFQNLQSELAVGSYFAPSRIDGQSDRLHATTGWEVNPYFINLGIGFDLSQDYRNLMIGVGLDIVRTLRTFDIIPRDPTPPYNGFLPNAVKISADGLPDTMTSGEEKNTHPPSVDDVSKIIEQVPTNIVDKVKGRPTSVEKSRMKKSHPGNKKAGPKKVPSAPPAAEKDPSANETPADSNHSAP